MKLNFAALFALFVIVFIWSALSPIWLPVVSFLQWVVGFACEALLFFLSSPILLILGLGLAVLGLLLRETIPGLKGL